MGRKEGTSHICPFLRQEGDSLPSTEALVPTYEKPLASHKSPRLFLAKGQLPSLGCKTQAHPSLPKALLLFTPPQAHSLKDCLVGLFGEVWQPTSEVSPLVPVCTIDTNSHPKTLETLSCEAYLSQD